MVKPILHVIHPVDSTHSATRIINGTLLQNTQLFYIRLSGKSIMKFFLNFLFPRLHAVAPRALCLVERLIGVLQDCFAIVAVFGENGSPN